jgi:molybdenum ABC transporter molybdate-binding protein
MPRPPRKADLPPPLWNPAWNLAVQAAVQHAGQTILDPPTAALLAALDRTRSISAAARDVGISYRHAWLLAQTANKHAGETLLTTATGGERGGGTQLTPAGSEALRVYQELQEHLRQAAVKVLPRLLKREADNARVLHVWAAISLQEVLAQLLTDVALLRPGLAIRTIYGASNELAEQILAGGAPDVFVSAGSPQLDRLVQAGLVARSARRVVAQNGLAVVAHASFEGKVRQPRDLARAFEHGIALADPACPLGTCTASFLEQAKLAEALPKRLKYEENSRAVVAAVQAGRAKLGLIFQSDCQQATGLRRLLSIPLTEACTTYEAGLLSSSPQPEAAALLEFLGSQEAQATWAQHGFAAVGKTKPRRAKTAS